MHLRPVLGVTRAELLAYAQTHGLEWVDDEAIRTSATAAMPCASR